MPPHRALPLLLLASLCSCQDTVKAVEWAETIEGDCYPSFFEAFEIAESDEARIARYNAFAIDGTMLLSEAFYPFFETFYAWLLTDPFYSEYVPADIESIDIGEIAVGVRPIECLGTPVDEENGCGNDLLFCIPEVEGETIAVCLPAMMDQDTTRWCSDGTFAGQLKLPSAEIGNIVIIMHDSTNGSDFGCYSETFDDDAPKKTAGVVFLGDLASCGSVEECEAGVEDDVRLTDRFEMCRQR